MKALLENWRKVFPEKLDKPVAEQMDQQMPEQAADPMPLQVVEAKVYARDCFDRFGNDLTANILSYMGREEQYRYIRVCKQWMYRMFDMTHNATLECPKSYPGFWNPICINGLQLLLRERENRRVWRMDILLTGASIAGLSEQLSNAPNLKHLKIEFKESTALPIIAETVLFQLNAALLDVKLQKFSLAIPLVFTRTACLEFFVKKFGPILSEFWINCSNQRKILQYLIHSLKHMPKLECLVFINCGRILPSTLIEYLGTRCPNLKRLCLYDLENPMIYGSIDKFVKTLPNLKYLILQKLTNKVRVSISSLRNIMISTDRCEPSSDAINYLKRHYHKEELTFYAKEYNFMLCATKDLFVHEIPKSVQSLVFMDYYESEDTVPFVWYLNEAMNRTSIRKLVVNRELIDQLVPIMGEKAKKNPKAKHLIGHDRSPWLWTSDEIPNLYSTYLYVLDSGNVI